MASSTLIGYYLRITIVEVYEMRDSDCEMSMKV